MGVTGWASLLRPLFTVAGRTTLAPTFYACSWSFTRFLLARAGGPRAFVARIPELQRTGLEATVLAASGQSLAAVRQAWLRQIVQRTGPDAAR